MKAKGKTPPQLKKLIRHVERGIIITLIGIMSLLLMLATVELFYSVYTELIDTSADKLVINIDNMLNIFGVFMLVLIGIELLDTIKVYFRENIIHVEVVMLVALIAIARKVIVLDFEQHSGMEILGISAIILAISAGYYLIKKTGGSGFVTKEKEAIENIEIKEEPISEDSDQTKTTKKIKKTTTETPSDRDSSHLKKPE